MAKHITNIHAHPWFDRHKYGIITFAIIFILIVPSIFRPFISAGFISSFGFVILTVASQALIALSKRKWIWLSTGWLIIVLNFINSSISERSEILSYIIYFLMFGYFFNISLRLLKQLWKIKEVNEDVIIGAFAGYLLIGVLGFFLLILCEMAFPGSFSIPHQADLNKDSYVSDLLYFTYITISTVGYGDIAPQLPLAKRLCVLLGMIGPFYLTSFGAIIISKYLNAQKN